MPTCTLAQHAGNTWRKAGPLHTTCTFCSLSVVLVPPRSAPLPQPVCSTREAGRGAAFRGTIWAPNFTVGWPLLGGREGRGGKRKVLLYRCHARGREGQGQGPPLALQQCTVQVPGRDERSRPQEQPHARKGHPKPGTVSSLCSQWVGPFPRFEQGRKDQTVDSIVKCVLGAKFTTHVSQGGVLHFARGHIQQLPR